MGSCHVYETIWLLETSYTTTVHAATRTQRQRTRLAFWSIGLLALPSNYGATGMRGLELSAGLSG